MSLSAALCCAAVATSGCFYLTAINERPRARVEEKTSGPYRVGDIAMFSATGSTDDRGAPELKVYWQAFSCDAPGGACTAKDSPQLLPSTSSDFIVAITAKGTLRVELELVDDQGASDKTFVELPVVNREPTIAIQAVSEFLELCSPAFMNDHVLGLPIHLAARPEDDDEDQLQTVWTYDPPAGAGSNPASVIFRPVAGATDVQELIADVPGTWTVTVTTTDDEGAAATAMQKVDFSPDSPSCLDKATPAVGAGNVVFLSGSTPGRFSVNSVCDSLDPYPVLAERHPLIGRSRLRWSMATVASGSTLTVMPGQDLGEVVIDPSIHAPGDHITLRVEATDRRNQPVACPSADPTCSEDGDSCSQRVTWEIEIR